MDGSNPQSLVKFSLPCDVTIPCWMKTVLKFTLAIIIVYILIVLAAAALGFVVALIRYNCKGPDQEQDSFMHMPKFRFGRGKAHVMQAAHAEAKKTGPDSQTTRPIPVVAKEPFEAVSGGQKMRFQSHSS